MTKEEKDAEKIALILIKFKNEESIQSISNDATTMAFRASRGWWELVGAPYFNARMQKLKEKIK
jgi:hypothetical protein